jgi:chromosome partitioning protein
MVWEQRKRRLLRDGGQIDWIVLRNRLSSLQARNKKDMEDALFSLAERVGFRVAGGFTERVIYRELFLAGLTMFDTLEDAGDIPFSMSHVAARQEVRQLMDALNLAPIWQRLAPNPANDTPSTKIIAA